MKRYLAFFLLSCCLFGFCLVNEGVGQTKQDSTIMNSAEPDTLLKGKSPMGALLRSVALPGWGQFYDHQYIKGTLVLGTETTFITLAVIEWSRMSTHKRGFQNTGSPYSVRQWEFEQFRFYEDKRNLYLWVTAGIVFLSMFDAYVDAQLYDFDKEKVRDLPISLVPTANRGISVQMVLNIQI
jgi:hypothetical protein